MPATYNSKERPLRNKRVLIAASPKTAARLSPALEGWGAQILPFQAIEIHKLQDKEALRRVLANLQEYDWIIFTSSYGVCYFLEHLGDQGLGIEQFSQAKICAVGPATASAAMEQGLHVDLVPEQFLAEGVLAALSEEAGGLSALAQRRVLLPRAREARDILSDELSAAGAFVDVLPCYETVRGKAEPEMVRMLVEDCPDLIVFTSSSNVTNLVAIVGSELGIRMLRSSVIAVLGPVTADTVHSLGKTPEILPEENTVPSLLQAIQAFFTRV